MHIRNTPPPHFGLDVVYKMGGVLAGHYGTDNCEDDDLRVTISITAPPFMALTECDIYCGIGVVTSDNGGDLTLGVRLTQL